MPLARSPRSELDRVGGTEQGDGRRVDRHRQMQRSAVGTQHHVAALEQRRQRPDVGVARHDDRRLLQLGGDALAQRQFVIAAGQDDHRVALIRQRVGDSRPFRLVPLLDPRPRTGMHRDQRRPARETPFRQIAVHPSAIHVVDRETEFQLIRLERAGQRLDQPRILDDGVFVLGIARLGQERCYVGQIVADAARDSGEIGQQRPPPVIGAQDDGGVVADAPQNPRRGRRQLVGRAPTQLCLGG